MFWWGLWASEMFIGPSLCFAPADLPAAHLPDGVLPPRRIRSGVIAGVADYGNKMGLPTVAGAAVSYTHLTLSPSDLV